MADELHLVDYVLGAAIVLPFAILLIKSYLYGHDGPHKKHGEKR